MRLLVTSHQHRCNSGDVSKIERNGDIRSRLMIVLWEHRIADASELLQLGQPEIAVRLHTTVRIEALAVQKAEQRICPLGGALVVGEDGSRDLRHRRYNKTEHVGSSRPPPLLQSMESFTTTRAWECVTN